MAREFMPAAWHRPFTDQCTCHETGTHDPGALEIWKHTQCPRPDLWLGFRVQGAWTVERELAKADASLSAAASAHEVPSLDQCCKGGLQYINGACEGQLQLSDTLLWS